MVSAIASSKSESKAESESARDDTWHTSAEPNEDTSEKTSLGPRTLSEKGAEAEQAADKNEDASEKSAKHG